MKKVAIAFGLAFVLLLSHVPWVVADGQATRALTTSGIIYLRSLFAGSGSGQYRPSGVLHVNTTPSGNTDGGEDTLWTWDLPANTLSRDGQAIRVTVFGDTASNTNSKTVRVRIGGTQIAGGSSSVSGANWQSTSVFVRRGAAVEVGHGLLRFSSSQPGNSFVSYSLNTTAAITLLVSGESAASASNDVVFRGAIVEFLDAP